ncbi:arsenate reductase ArsC [Sulfurimonas aquatica]|uniref:arsenate reductase/protein-tyrosine-phosphatase family protein n=1 Tax=Sulfurimonas aquatica TaxID=2672570 RepID=UPI001A9804BB|nr:arsenate reductase ArsC [Sulfurimonas aquatica]
MNKKVLLLCSDNSSLSIIAQAILTKYLSEIDFFSGATKKSKKIDANVIKSLSSHLLWRDEYNSKVYDQNPDINYDLVITLCDKSSKECPKSLSKSTQIQIEYDVPTKNSLSEIEQIIKEMKMELIPIVRNELSE